MTSEEGDERFIRNGHLLGPRNAVCACPQPCGHPCDLPKIDVQWSMTSIGVITMPAHRFSSAGHVEKCHMSSTGREQSTCTRCRWMKETR